MAKRKSKTDKQAEQEKPPVKRKSRQIAEQIKGKIKDEVEQLRDEVEARASAGFRDMVCFLPKPKRFVVSINVMSAEGLPTNRSYTTTVEGQACNLISDLNNYLRPFEV